MRLGLVLYGGVSLAIYIYGVVYEFWRLVRASRHPHADEGGNAYCKILEETETAATVDIISGASAGGINGVLLAKALVTGADLGVLRSIWVEAGDFQKLMRDRGDRQPRSMLRSDLFDQLISEGLTEMDRRSDNIRLVEIMDLFVPGTRLRGWLRTYLDDLGQAVQTREFRKVFHLRFRQQGYNPTAKDLGYPQNDFLPASNELIGEVARATSAFPFAFEPKLIVRRDQDPRFVREEPEAEYFADGGILHNKPYSEAITAIFKREADRPVDRWLVSVEPDPQRAPSEIPPGPVPEVTEVVTKALSGIPRYQNIAADLDRLREHKDRVDKAQQLIAEAERLLDGVFRPLVEAPLGLLGAFGAEPLATQVQYQSYLVERRKALLDELVDRLVACGGLEESDRPGVLAGVLDYALDIGEPPERLNTGFEFVDAIDAALERRRIYYLLDLLGRASAKATPAQFEELSNAHHRLWAQFERANNALWTHFGAESAAATALRGQRGAPLLMLAKVVADLMPTLVTSLSEELLEIANGTTLAADQAQADLQRVEPAEPPEPLRFPLSTVARRYVAWDMFILPIERTSGAAERDPISFINLSPEAATYIRRGKDEKVAGDALGHFGGFLKREWRENDIIWGRLDAAEVIVRIILAGKSVPEIEAAIRSVQEEIAFDEVPMLQDRPPGSYRHYFEREHNVGAEALADVPIADRASVATGGAEVFRNMLRRLSNADPAPGKSGAMRSVYGLLGRALGFGLFLLRWPVRAVWGRDVAVRRLATLLVLAGALWATITLILILFTDAIDEPSRGLWTAIAIAFGIFLAYSLLLGIAGWAAFQVRLAARAYGRLASPAPVPPDQKQGTYAELESEEGYTVASPLTIRIGDTRPPLLATLRRVPTPGQHADRSPGRPIDLTGKTVVLVLRDRVSGAEVVHDCEILGPKTGRVRYQWAQGETRSGSDFDCRFRISHTGSVETVPTVGAVTVSIRS